MARTRKRVSPEARAATELARKRRNLETSKCRWEADWREAAADWQDAFWELCVAQRKEEKALCEWVNLVSAMGKEMWSERPAPEGPFAAAPSEGLVRYRDFALGRAQFRKEAYEDAFLSNGSIARQSKIWHEWQTVALRKGWLASSP